MKAMSKQHAVLQPEAAEIPAQYPHYSVVPTTRIYVVTVPELVGCMTHGRTLDEAAQQAKDAIESWVDSARRHGEQLPELYFWIDNDSN